MGMGYQGFVKFVDGANDYVVLATASSVNLVLEPIYSTAVWGAGWYNAASAAHYADNAIRFEGSVDIEMQKGASGAIWNLLEKWISSERAYSRSLEISPDGARVYVYANSGGATPNYDLTGAWNSSASFSTSEGSFVTASLGVIALDRSEEDPAGNTDFSDYTYISQKEGVIASACSTLLAATNPLNPDASNVNPIPYWRTNAVLSRGTYPGPFGTTVPAQTDLETVEWSVDVSQNPVILYTCNGNRLPTAVLQGPQDVTGTVVLYHTDGVFDPILGPTGSGNLTQPYMYAENTWFQVAINDGTNDCFFELPAVVVESDDYGIAGQDSVTNRSFSVKGLGGRCDSAVTLPPFIMSDNTGAFVSP